MSGGTEKTANAQIYVSQHKGIDNPPRWHNGPDLALMLKTPLPARRIQGVAGGGLLCAVMSTPRGCVGDWPIPFRPRLPEPFIIRL